MTPRTPTRSADRPVDAPGRRRLPPLLRTSWYSLNQAFRRRLLRAGLNLTPDQFTILRWLDERESEGMSQRQLSELMSSDPNTITSVLNRMQKSKFIVRKRHETDRRANRICLTPVGKRAYGKARNIAVKLQREVLAALPESRRERFLESLAVVAEASQRASENSRP